MYNFCIRAKDFYSNFARVMCTETVI